MPAPWSRRRLAKMLSAPVFLAGCVTATQAPNSNPDAVLNERLVRAFWDAFNRADWAALDDLVSPAYVHHPAGAALSLAQFKAGGAWVHQGLADYRLIIDQLISASQTVAIRWTATGRHVGSMFGEMPTGRQVIAHGMHFHHVIAGRIVEDWEVIDMDQFKQQLRSPA